MLIPREHVDAPTRATRAHTRQARYSATAIGRKAAARLQSLFRCRDTFFDSPSGVEENCADPQTRPRMAKNSLESTVILVVFLAAVLWSLGVASFGWSHAISDAYGWRQTQTAITAYFMQQGGPWLNYETPVLGPPWALPHEFPVYQLVVAALANITGLQLEAAGRAVSLGFFYATLAVAYLLFAELGVSPRHRLLVLSFWLVSPLYLFWSRTFMIESTALFLSLAFLTFGGRFFARGRHLDLVTAVLSGGSCCNGGGDTTSRPRSWEPSSSSCRSLPAGPGIGTRTPSRDSIPSDGRGLLMRCGAIGCLAPRAYAPR